MACTTSPRLRGKLYSMLFYSTVVLKLLCRIFPIRAHTLKLECLKLLCLICQPKVDGFKVMMPHFNGNDEGLQTSCRDLKSMHLGNVGHVVHEMAIFFCYCLGPFVLRSSKNEKCMKLFCSISPANLYGFKFPIHHFKVHAKPVKMNHDEPKSIQIWQRN